MASIIDSDVTHCIFKHHLGEGPDGVGKSTFSATFAHLLKRRGHPVKIQHFPNKVSNFPTRDNGRILGWNPVSSPVNEYLNSGIAIVGNPKAVAHIYTQDRLLTWFMDCYTDPDTQSLRSDVIDMCENKKPTDNTPVVIFDRYTQSSEIYQGVDMLDEDQDKFAEWLEDYEYNQLNLPRPDRVIYLDAPVEWIIKQVNDRSKLLGYAKDLHEVDNDFLADVCVSGRKLALYRSNWEIVDMTTGNGNERKWANVSDLTKEVYDDIFETVDISVKE